MQLIISCLSYFSSSLSTYTSLSFSLQKEPYLNNYVNRNVIFAEVLISKHVYKVATVVMYTLYDSRGLLCKSLLFQGVDSYKLHKFVLEINEHQYI